MVSRGASAVCRDSFAVEGAVWWFKERVRAFRDGFVVFKGGVVVLRGCFVV